MALYKKFGIICVCIVAYQIIKYVHEIIIIVFSKQLHLQPDLTVQGRWAVITGGAEGIGRAFADAFASRGLNVIILGLTDEKLNEVAKEITLKYNVETKFFAADFSQVRDIYTYLEKQLENYEIGILVNAIGLCYQYPEYFVDVPFGDKYYQKYISSALYNQIINTNIYPVIHLCKIVLKGMYKRKRGIIINVSSTTAEVSSPMLAVYAASKAYITKFTEDLCMEYLNHGILIQCLQPGFVSQNVAPVLSWMRPSPIQYVESALKSLGIKNKTCGFLPHSTLFVIFTIMEKMSPYHTRRIIRTLMEKMRNVARARQYGGYPSEFIF